MFMVTATPDKLLTRKIVHIHQLKKVKYHAMQYQQFVPTAMNRVLMSTFVKNGNWKTSAAQDQTPKNADSDKGLHCLY